MEGLKFFITGVEYTGFSIVKLAIDFGFKNKPHKVEDVHRTIIESVIYLRNKDVNVKVMLPSGDEMIGIPDKMQDDKVNVPDKNKIDINVDEDEMVVLFEDGIYRVDPLYLNDDECWDVQLFGNPGCTGCDRKNKVECFGQEVLATGHNIWGSLAPLAIRLGNREIRKKEGK